MGRWALLVALLVAGGCTVTSIDAEFKAKIEACETIVDERIRADCIRDVPSTPKDDR